MIMLDVAWLAGIIEGEGCVDSPRGNPRLRIKMTDEDVVRRAAALMGASVYTDTWNNRQNPRHRPTWVAQLTGERALAVLREVRPLMGARRGEKIDGLL